MSRDKHRINQQIKTKPENKLSSAERKIKEIQQKKEKLHFQPAFQMEFDEKGNSKFIN